MKKIYTLFVLQVSVICCTAQWAVSGNDLFNTNIGGIGIGITAPTAPLHIRSPYDNILNLQTSDNNWLYTQW
jgi:hypothetical protein